MGILCWYRGDCGCFPAAAYPSTVLKLPHREKRSTGKKSWGAPGSAGVARNRNRKKPKVLQQIQKLEAECQLQLAFPQPSGKVSLSQDTCDLFHNSWEVSAAEQSKFQDFFLKIHFPQLLPNRMGLFSSALRPCSCNSQNGWHSGLRITLKGGSSVFRRSVISRLTCLWHNCTLIIGMEKPDQGESIWSSFTSSRPTYEWTHNEYQSKKHNTLTQNLYQLYLLLEFQLFL